MIVILILTRSECGDFISHSHSAGHAPVNLSLSHFPSIVKVTSLLKHSQKQQVTFANVTLTRIVTLQMISFALATPIREVVKKY